MQPRLSNRRCVLITEHTIDAISCQIHVLFSVETTQMRPTIVGQSNCDLKIKSKYEQCGARTTQCGPCAWRWILCSPLQQSRRKLANPIAYHTKLVEYHFNSQADANSKVRKNIKKYSSAFQDNESSLRPTWRGFSLKVCCEVDSLRLNCTNRSSSDSRLACHRQDGPSAMR